MAITEKLQVEKTDGIGTLILNQANKRNAISFEIVGLLSGNRNSRGGAQRLWICSD